MSGSARFAAVRRVVCACALVLLLACGAARSDSVFTVAGVAINAEAASAAEARKRAIAAGQRTALEILLRRLTVAGTALPAPDADVLATAVAGFAIDRELVSATRYRASLTVDFDPGAVRRLLRGSGVAYAETVSKPVLVVAVERAESGVLLWEDGNRWRRAWEERPDPGGLVPLLLPLGDVVDLGTVNAAQAIASNRDALATLAALYGAAEVAVAVADVTGPGSPPPPAAGEADGRVPAADLALSVRRIAADSGERVVEETLAGREGENQRALLERGVERVVTMLEDDWKAGNLIRYDEEHALKATVPIESLAAWVSIQRRLADLAVVGSVVIDALSRKEGRLTLRYHGSADQLRLALDQVDLVLAPAPDGWTLQPRPADAAAPTAPAPDEAD